MDFRNLQVSVLCLRMYYVFQTKKQAYPAMLSLSHTNTYPQKAISLFRLIVYIVSDFLLRTGIYDFLPLHRLQKLFLSTHPESNLISHRTNKNRLTEAFCFNVIKSVFVKGWSKTIWICRISCNTVLIRDFKPF